MPLQVDLPLRILIMVSSPTAQPRLNVDGEKTKLRNALADLERAGLIKTHWLETATVSELQKTLRSSSYHVFHFIGHGDFDAETEEGWLAFEDPKESEARVTAEQLAAILNNHRSLRLIVLNSCAGAATSRANAFAGTAATLVQKGIPAVAAMQFIISDEAAIKFSGEFYAAIADGLPAEVAMAEARVALFSGFHRFEWGTPVLFMRASDGVLFKLDKVQSDKIAGASGETDGESGAHHQSRKPSSFLRSLLKKTSAKSAALYALATGFFATIIFLILAILPGSTLMDVVVYAKYVSFLLPEESEEPQISLLNSNMLTSSIDIEGFQTINLIVDSLLVPGINRRFDNPLSITPDSREGRITFLFSSKFSLQDVICSPGSKVALQRIDEKIHLIVQGSLDIPYLTLSLPETVDILAQACSVTDASGRDMMWLFQNQGRIKLHTLSASLRVKGKSGELHASIKRDLSDAPDRAKFMLKQLVQSLEFSKTIVRPRMNYKLSTIDSIFVARSFPLEDISFSPRGAGVLEMEPKPNRFELRDISELDDGFKIQALGRLNSLIIGRRELVPGYLDLITQNPTISVFFTCVAWIVTVVIPLFLKFRAGNKSEVLHE